MLWCFFICFYFHYRNFFLQYNNALKLKCNVYTTYISKPNIFSLFRIIKLNRGHHRFSLFSNFINTKNKTAKKNSNPTTKHQHHWIVDTNKFYTNFHTYLFSAKLFGQSKKSRPNIQQHAFATPILYICVTHQEKKK